MKRTEVVQPIALLKSLRRGDGWFAVGEGFFCLKIDQD